MTEPNILDHAAALFVEARTREFWRYFESRHISAETLDAFRIGYVPPSALLARVPEDVPQYLAIGLLDRRHYRRSGQLAPRHARTYSFPHTEASETVGMVFRVTSDDVEGSRYYNLDKSDHLPFPPHRIIRPMFYGADGLSETVITLVEGPVDMLRCWQAGIPNPVALCGLGVSDDGILDLLIQPRLVRLFLDWEPKGRRRTLGLALRYLRYMQEQEACGVGPHPRYCGRLEVAVPSTRQTAEWDDDDPGGAPSDADLRQIYHDSRMSAEEFVQRMVEVSTLPDDPWHQALARKYVASGGYLGRPLDDPVRPRR